MLSRLFWTAVFIGCLAGGYHWLYGSRPTADPHASPRSAMNAFCAGVDSADPTVMGSICLGEAREQIQSIRAELDRRAGRGAPVVRAWVEGNTAPSGGSAQGLIMIQDSTGSRLPMWDVYLARDDQGRWWIERFTSR